MFTWEPRRSSKCARIRCATANCWCARRRGFYEVGTRAKIDVARAEANLYTAQADLIAAENGVKIAWVTLRNAMGSPRLPEQPVAEDSPEVEFSMNLAGARNVAFDTRTELKSFEAQRRASDQLIAVARRGHLPDIDLRCQLWAAPCERSKYGSTLNTFPLQPTWSVRLSLNIPIFDGFRTTNRVEETLHNYYNVKAQEEDRRQLIALEVEQSYLRVVETQERIRATESAAKAAKENLDLAQGRYQVGVGSIIEVTDAETLYTDAQTTYIRTVYEYKIADAQLARAMGDTRVGVLKPGLDQIGPTSRKGYTSNPMKRTLWILAFLIVVGGFAGFQQYQSWSLNKKPQDNADKRNRPNGGARPGARPGRRRWWPRPQAGEAVPVLVATAVQKSVPIQFAPLATSKPTPPFRLRAKSPGCFRKLILRKARTSKTDNCFSPSIRARSKRRSNRLKRHWRAIARS